MKKIWNHRVFAALALLTLAACGENTEHAAAGGEEVAAAEPAAPEPVPVDAGQWTVATDVWKVEGEGIDAATAKAMRGQKAEVTTCIDPAGAQRSYVALVEASMGTECQQTAAAAEAPRTGSDTPRLRGTLSCKGGDGQETPATFVVDTIDGQRMTGSLERTATAPDGKSSVSMHVNMTATRSGDCG